VVWLLFVIGMVLGVSAAARPLQPIIKGLLSHVDPTAHAIVSDAINPLLLWGSVVVATRLAWLTFRKDRDYGRYGLRAARVGRREFLLGALVGIAGLLVSAGAIWAAGGFKFSGQVTGLTVVYGLLWLVAYTGVAFFEEFMFRGYLLTSLADGIGVRWAAVLTAVLFALAHSGNPNENPAGLVNVAMIGIVFALCVMRTGSLWLPAGIHLGWNWAQTFLIGSNNSGNPAAGAMLKATPVGHALVSGGTVGIEGSLFSLIGMAVILGFILKTWPKTTFERLPLPVAEEPVPVVA